MPPLIIFTSKSAKSNHHADPESQARGYTIISSDKQWCNRRSWQ